MVISVLATLLLWASPPPAPAPTTHPVTGTVVDASAGVLPGVSVVAAAPDGRVLGTTVTDGTGVFTFTALPAGRVALRFQLNGFAEATTTVTVPSPDNAKLVQRLELSSLSAAVTVHAELPPPPPPPRVLAPVPDHDPSSVCGPAKVEGIVPAYGAIKSRRTSATQGLFARGDELVVDTGTIVLVGVGQNFVVRRQFATPLVDGRKQVVMGEHTSGLVQIVEVHEPTATATAVVVYACDEIMMRDYLAPFEPAPPGGSAPAGAPDFDRAARLLFADAGQMLGSKHRLLVMAHGSRHGVTPGQRVTIFRKAIGGGSPLILGDAVVVAVRRESATVRVERAVDVIFLGESGDWVAPQRQAATGRQP